MADKPQVTPEKERDTTGRTERRTIALTAEEVEACDRVAAVRKVDFSTLVRNYGVMEPLQTYRTLLAGPKVKGS
jgi:hypothetical protein